MDGGGMAPPPTALETTYISPAPHAAAAGIRIENCYVFKSRLQEYAQKAGLPTPEYHTFKEGPSHEPIFKSTVVINNTKYDSLPGFFNRKAAEQSAAEVALMEIFKSIPTNASIPAVQETGLCKNLLQEYAQKMNYAIPSYISTKQASGVAPFICTVEIGGIQYIGAAARTKKEAEIKAARTALLAIQGQSEGCANGATKYIVVPGKRQGKEALKKPIETPKPLKVKKVGFKKKWNKRKFMKKNGQAVDVEKDETRMVGDVYDSDVPMQPTTITQVPSSDIILLQPDEESRRLEQELPRDTAMVQPNEEARSVKQEPPSGTAMLQPDEEASRVELEPPRDTATVQPNEEARSVKQEPLSDTAMPQPNGEARRVEPESLSEFATTVQPNGEAASMKKDPPSNSAIMRRNNEARTVNQEPPSNASLLQPNNEPIVENSESVYENKNQISILASLETNKSVGSMPGMGSDPSSTAMSEEQIVVVE